MKNSKLAVSLFAAAIALAGCSKESPKPAANKGATRGCMPR